VEAMCEIDNFEELIRNELDIKANKIDPSEKVLADVSEKIKNGNKQSSKLRHRRLLMNAFPVNLNIKTYIAAAIVFVLMAPGFTMLFSKEARVIAAEGIERIGKWIYVVQRTEDGFDSVKYEIKDDYVSDLNFDYTGMTDEELSKEIGSEVYMPSELWGGYKFIQRNKGVSIKDNKTVDITGIYSKKNDGMVLSIRSGSYAQIDEYIEYIKMNEKYQMYKVKDFEFYWVEGSPQGIYPDHDLQKKPVGIKTNHYLIWKHDGLSYELSRQSQDFDLYSAKEITKLFVNKTFPSCDKKESVGVIRSQTYLPQTTTIGEIEEMVGFKVKIPEKISKDYELKTRLVGMDPFEKDCNMFTGKYENGKTVLELIITEGAWPMQEFDRIKDPNDDTRLIVAGESEYKWTYADGSHMLGWKNDCVYYCIHLESGDFDSVEEALKIANEIGNK